MLSRSLRMNFQYMCIERFLNKIASLKYLDGSGQHSEDYAGKCVAVSWCPAASAAAALLSAAQCAQSGARRPKSFQQTRFDTPVLIVALHLSGAITQRDH